jgi:flagellar basal body-associated protein FliL
MAEANLESTAAPQTKGGVQSFLSLVGGVAAGIAIGVSVGLFVLGPKLAPASPVAHSSAAGTSANDSTQHLESAKRSHTPTTPLPIHLIENLVLNPAGSNGTRFLLLSVAIAANDEATIGLLKARDAEIRDHILRFFGSKSVDQVWAASERDELRKEVLTLLNELFPSGSINTVYFPQFVLQ